MEDKKILTIEEEADEIVRRLASPPQPIITYVNMGNEIWSGGYIHNRRKKKSSRKKKDA